MEEPAGLPLEEEEEDEQRDEPDQEPDRSTTGVVGYGQHDPPPLQQPRPIHAADRKQHHTAMPPTPPPPPPLGEDGSAGFGFGHTGQTPTSRSSSRSASDPATEGSSSSGNNKRAGAPRRLPSRRRSSFSVAQPPQSSIDVSRSATPGGGADGVSSTAVIVASSRLGAGASGVAFSVENLIDGRTYVLKRIRLDPATVRAAAGPGGLEALYNEPRLHSRLKHGNIISYQYAWVEQEDESGASALCILLERADAELWQALVRPDANNNNNSDQRADSSSTPTSAPAPPPVALGVGARLRMAYELASALAAIHQAGVVHRDLSPWNVFIAQGSAKVGDFGLAASLPLPLPVPQDSDDDANNSNHHTNASFLSGLQSPDCMPLDESALGSIFSAPELGSAAYGHAVDVFSLGLCLFTLLFRGSNQPTNNTPTNTNPHVPPPLLDADDLVDAIDRVRRDPILGIKPHLLLPGVPEGLVPLLQRMVAADPTKRPVAQEVKEGVRAIVVMHGMQGPMAAAGVLGVLPRDDSMGFLKDSTAAAVEDEKKSAPAPTSTRGNKDGRPPLPPAPTASQPAHHRPVSAPVQLPPAVLSLSSKRAVEELMLPESGADGGGGKEEQQLAGKGRKARQQECVLM